MRLSIARKRPFGRFSKAAAAVAVSAVLAFAGCAPAAVTPPIPAPLPPPPPAPPPPLPSAEPSLRVGILVDTTMIEVGGTTEFEVVDAGTGASIARLPANQTATVEGRIGGGLVIRAGGTETPVTGTVTVTPSGDGFVRIGGKSYRGTAFLRPASDGRVTAVNQVNLESYLLGVVPFEIGRVGPELLQAAKAQTVAARTYAISYLGRREELGFDVFATVQDQVYGGAEGEHEPISQAVRETAGEILVFDRRPIEAYYHSTCAGQTAAIEDVWPGELSRPYLVSIVDLNPATGTAFDSVSTRFRWTQTWTDQELISIFNQTLADSLPPGVSEVGELYSFQVLDRSNSGRIRWMRIVTAGGTFDLGGDRIRWIFLTPSGGLLNSSKFDIRVGRDAQGIVREVTAEGMGWGHGIGMCQVGAMGRARTGQGYLTILEAYYPNTTLTKLY